MSLLRRDSVRLALIIGVILLIALPTITYPLGRDQGEFATLGRGLLDGRAPYADLWNPKPPAVFYVYAGALALWDGNNPVLLAPTLRIIDLLIFPLIALGLWQIGRRLGGARIGEWAVVLFGAFYFSETFWTLTQNDGIALLPMVWAAYCLIKAADGEKGSPWWALAAGALSGWAFWFKYPFALLPLMLGIAALVTRLLVPADQRTRWGWQTAAAFPAGFIAVAALGALILLQMGALDDLIESVRVTAGYTALGFNTDEFRRGFRIGIETRFAHWGVLFALVIVLPVISVISRRSGQNRGAWLSVHLWALAALGILIVQAKGYDYHWLPLLPPLTLYGAAALEAGIGWLKRGMHVARALVVVLLLLIPAFTIGGFTRAFLFQGESYADYYARFRAGEFVADESLLVAEYLRARTVPGDSLFIWGFRPEVYPLSGLKPATRFIFHFPLVASWYPPEWQREAVDTLWAAMPPYVLVLQADYLDWVTGRANADSNTLLQEFTDLNNWLMANYQPETQIGNFFVWRRADP